MTETQRAAMQQALETLEWHIEALKAERVALRAELREATEAVDDPAVNNLRTLPQSIRMLRAQRTELRSTLMELFIRLHVSGRRSEECYEMSLIDAALRVTK